MPTIAEVFSQALHHHQAGNLQAAEQLYLHVLQTDPGHADTHHLLGVLACQQGHHTNAVAAISHALSLNPGAAAYYANLGVAQEALGNREEAEASFRQALRLQGDNTEAHGNLGNVLFVKGQLDQALTHYRQAVRLRPEYPEAHFGLGNVAWTQGDGEEATLHYERALRYRPDYAEAHNGLGNVLLRRGQLDGAAKHYRNALRIRPDFSEANNGLGNALVGLGELELAVSHYRQALRSRPDRSQVENVEAWNNLGNVLARQNKMEEAVSSFNEALRIKPVYAETHYNLGNTLLRSGRPDLAVNAFREALCLQPDMALAQSNLLFCLNYDPDADPDEVFREHRHWGQQVESDIGLLPHDNDPDPERRLRIGYASPDLRHHALMRYLEPALLHLDPQEVEVFCYAEVCNPDAVTARLQGLVQGWRWTHGLADSAVAEQIRSDRIDILVDLAGHTNDNRLRVFAHRPAPIQVTWLGYLNTTGLTNVDYRLTDDVLDPLGQPVRDMEKLLRLPGGMCCFLPPTDAPPVNSLPALERGHLTFGSLHGAIKLNARVLDLWSSVLKALPTARLLMFHDSLGGTARTCFRRQFTERGIGDDQLDLREGSSKPGYLAVYGEIDVSLDPFPFTGGVTTCESMWMGVPVISICGVRPPSRNSAALLARVGLADWAVTTPKQYVAWATQQAGQLERLAQVRAQLRDRMLDNCCDARRFTRELQDACRTVWRRWCTGRAG